MTRAEAQEVGRRAIQAMAQPHGCSGSMCMCRRASAIAFYPAGWRQRGHADGPRRCGHVQRQGARPQQRAVLCRGHEHWLTQEPRAIRKRAARSASQSGQFELHYQPKVDTSTGRINSAEALIRWRHPQRGLVPPGDFIAIAEECGLLDAIGEWVLLEACRQAQAWQTEGVRPLRVAVNLAPSQFRLQQSGRSDPARTR